MHSSTEENVYVVPWLDFLIGLRTSDTDQKVKELYVLNQNADCGKPTDICKARVLQNPKSLEGFFVEYQSGKKGFVKENDPSKMPGDQVLVQLLYPDREDKPPTFSISLQYPGFYSIWKPGQEKHRVSQSLGQDAQTAWKKALQKEGLPQELLIRTAAGPFSAEKVELLKKEVEAFEDLKKKTSGLGLFEIQKVHSATEHATIKLLTGKTGALYLPEVQKAEDLRFCQTKAKIGKTKNLTDLPEPIRRELKQALSTNVSLTGGGSVCFERTTAMHTADVNSAGYNAKTPYAQAVASINKAAATCIAEQICLRNLSGLIAIDFISGEEKSVATELVGAMQTILESGKQKFEIQAVDAFGICILSRRRSGLSLDDVLGFDRQNLRKHL